MLDTPVSKLPNIGATLSKRLGSINIHTRDDLETVGAAAAYNLICEQAGRFLPVCYNLYSLEAALKGHDWRLLSDEEKALLKNAAAQAN